MPDEKKTEELSLEDAVALIASVENAPAIDQLRVYNTILRSVPRWLLLSRQREVQLAKAIAELRGNAPAPASKETKEAAPAATAPTPSAPSAPPTGEEEDRLMGGPTDRPMSLKLPEPPSGPMPPPEQQ